MARESVRAGKRRLHMHKLAETHPRLEQRWWLRASHGDFSERELQKDARGLGRVKNDELSALVGGLRENRSHAVKRTARRCTCG